MSVAIGYVRVSTKLQGCSGVGLAAQRDDIERFALQQDLKIKSWYQDIQTGGGGCVDPPSGPCASSEGSEGTEVSTNRCKARSTVSERSFRQRTYGTPRPFHGRGVGKRL